ncbi:hypothetical protein N7492_009326 [Penicillium capsulatum]|uniref:Uncharacterized protein n=1 Tax=Penicillium capsulatum TaxID=69766 RepID=A0A9W9LHT8_9EURO|nr:hypothetical protein N7492_009326 [Penicillium capsulatum]
MEPTKYTIQKRSQLNKNDFTHLVVPHNGKDSSAMKDLNETITSMTGTTYVHAFVSDGATKWFYAGLNSDQVKELEGNSRVNYIVENLPIDPYRADSIDTRSYEADLGGDPGKILPSSRSKRDQQKYTSQIEGQDKKNMPPDELRIMSTPEGVEWECRAKYYYPSEAGEGIQIDSIEEVRFNSNSERQGCFPHLIPRSAHQTNLAREFCRASKRYE